MSISRRPLHCLLICLVMLGQFAVAASPMPELLESDGGMVMVECEHHCPESMSDLMVMTDCTDTSCVDQGSCCQGQPLMLPASLWASAANGLTDRLHTSAQRHLQPCYPIDHPPKILT